MPNYSTSKQLRNLTALAATANSGAIEFPVAPSYMFILDVAAGTGTSPTLDIAIQVSPDSTGGTTGTWYTVGRFGQVTGSAVKSFKMVRNGLAYGEAAFVQAIADTGGAVDKNFVFTRYVRILETVGGTNPAFATYKLWVIPQTLDFTTR